MHIDIKARLLGRRTKPVAKSDLITDLLYAALGLVLAFGLAPALVANGTLRPEGGRMLEVGFAIIAGLHVLDFIVHAVSLRKQKAVA